MGKKSTKTTSKTVYGNTTTANPYITSQTTNKGTTSMFTPGSAYGTINNFVNKNIGGLLDQYMNPTLNSVTNQSKMNSYINKLNNETKKNLENNIINPLSQRNMIRSSQANDMYNNLAQNNANQISNYANELLAKANGKLVLPVDAQIIALAPSSAAFETAIVIPLSLNEPVGFNPSNFK